MAGIVDSFKATFTRLTGGETLATPVEERTITYERAEEWLKKANILEAGADQDFQTAFADAKDGVNIKYEEFLKCVDKLAETKKKNSSDYMKQLADVLGLDDSKVAAVKPAGKK